MDKNNTKVAITQTLNFDQANLDFISQPFSSLDSKSNTEFTLVQKNAPCKVNPCVSGMKFSADLLMD